MDEVQTRFEYIDKQLKSAGWDIQNKDEVNLVDHKGVAVREVVLNDRKQVDYLLYINKQIVGIIEAKPLGKTLSDVQWQSRGYSKSLKSEQKLNAVLINDEPPFIYEASGSETYFTNLFDPQPVAKNIFSFHQPSYLEEVISKYRNNESPTWKNEILNLPELSNVGLRNAQYESITSLEKFLTESTRDRALVQMATGSGKTYMTVNLCYRLLKYSNFRRILFLVDRTNLGEQALNEFENFIEIESNQNFKDQYGVDILLNNNFKTSTSVDISTIQSMYSHLSGDIEINENTEMKKPVNVSYSHQIPPETYDLIIVDECHRSIYGVWRNVLNYFNAPIVGLTATPTKTTLGFFEQNMVSEYSFPQSVADGVNVDFDIYRIKTKISESGSEVEAENIVPILNKKTREQRLELLDNEYSYDSSDLDRNVTSIDQIRTILETFKNKLFVEIFPNRTVVPKTLIFAKDDNHAEEIVKEIKKVFQKGNDFVAKITYRNKDAKKLLREFRNSSSLRIAVTVDMIATGTDIKPIECVFFMRDVKSSVYFEQMKGRGCRTLNDEDFQAVTPDSKRKNKFVIIDAIGVTEHEHIIATPLERKKNVSLKKLLEDCANFTLDIDGVTSLGSRLSKLHRNLSKEQKNILNELSPVSFNEIINNLVSLGDVAFLDKNIDFNNYDDELKNVMDKFVEPIASSVELRNKIIELSNTVELLIDEISQDELVESYGIIDEEKAQFTVDSWKNFIEENKEEITALQIIYSKTNSNIKFTELKTLLDKLQSSNSMMTIENIWSSYKSINPNKVKESKLHTLTDLISLVKFSIGYTKELIPFKDQFDIKFTEWISNIQIENPELTDDQIWWLKKIKDTIVENGYFELEDFDRNPFNRKGGSDGLIRDFGKNGLAYIDQLNKLLVS